MEYKLVLKDGTEITCLLNGNNYITTEDVSKVDFSDENFKQISVNGEALSNQKCTNVFTEDDGTHIIFRQLTNDEITIAEQNAVINDLLAYVLGGM